MSFSKLTDQYKPSRQRSSRNGATVDTILWHHQAGTNDDSVISMMVSGARTVSSNYTISNEGRITCVVDEEDRAWTSGSVTDGGKGAAWDRRAITVEIENETGAPDWQISTAAINAAARLRKDLQTRYGIVHELGHRDLYTLYRASYPTYCPGPNTVARIQSVAVGGIKPAQPAPAPALKPAAPINYAYGLTQATVFVVQKALMQRRLYAGIIDGIAGPLTVRSLQTYLKSVKALPATYVVDGVPGPIYGKALQTMLKAYGYKGPIDGVFGPMTNTAAQRWANAMMAKPVAPNEVDGTVEADEWKKMQYALRSHGYGGPLDGIPGPNTYRALQTWLRKHGYTGLIDGIPGKLTWSAFQRVLRGYGYQGPIDGVPGRYTWMAFQRYTNSI